MINFKINWLRVATGVLLGCLILPWLMVVPPAGTTADQAQLDRIIARVERLAVACDNPHLRGVLYYAARYDRVDRLTVRIIPLPGIAGMNVPYTPGITIDRETWEDEDIALQILVHEAMHDFPPCFGHFHIRGWVACDGETNELELLMRDVP